MARPQPARAAALQPRQRPQDHVFAQAAEPAVAAESPVPAAPTAVSRNAATPPSRNAATEAESLVKFSIRVEPAKHRHIKATAAQQGMSIQDLAVTAISEYLQRLGHPLP